MPNPHSPSPVRSSSWANADHIGGLLWLVFGAAVFYGSWTMDRLESQNINPVTAPGLVPGLIGLSIMALALVLLFRRNKSAGVVAFDDRLIESTGEQSSETPLNWRRLGLSWLLCVGFAGVLLGRGLPFWLLAGIFVFLHVLLLDDPDRIAKRPLVRRVLFAAAIAIATAAFVTIVFQEVFLVRLP